MSISFHAPALRGIFKYARCSDLELGMQRQRYMHVQTFNPKSENEMSIFFFKCSTLKKIIRPEETINFVLKNNSFNTKCYPMGPRLNSKDMNKVYILFHKYFNNLIE